MTTFLWWADHLQYNFRGNPVTECTKEIYQALWDDLKVKNFQGQTRLLEMAVGWV